MSKLIFAVFYSEESGAVKEDRRYPALEEYEEYMILGKRVLEVTNPGAQYVVLTDAETAAKLSKKLTTAVVCSRTEPLMLRSILAQRNFLQGCQKDAYVVLAAPDCLAVRDLHEAVPVDVDIGLTWRDHFFRVNNIGYIRNVEVGLWYLNKALKILYAQRVDYHLWWGDMLAWELALGPWRQLFRGFGYDDDEASLMYDTGQKLIRPEGHYIMAYPCATHNYSPPKGKQIPRKMSPFVFLVHFKGPRKWKMDAFAHRFVFKDVEIPVPLDDEVEEDAHTRI